MPLVNAISAETRETTREFLALRMKMITVAAPMSPRAVSQPVGMPGAPNSASINSSPEAIRLPIASATENTTPTIVSVDILVLSSMPQIRTVPNNSIARAPATGWKWKSKATPMPGSATCEMASAASVILRMTAKQPTKPAAEAMLIESANEPSSRNVMDMKPDGHTVKPGEYLGREDGLRRPNAAIVPAKAQNVGGVSVNDT